MKGMNEVAGNGSRAKVANRLFIGLFLLVNLSLLVTWMVSPDADNPMVTVEKTAWLSHHIIALCAIEIIATWVMAWRGLKKISEGIVARDWSMTHAGLLFSLALFNMIPMLGAIGYYRLFGRDFPGFVVFPGLFMMVVNYFGLSRKVLESARSISDTGNESHK